MTGSQVEQHCGQCRARVAQHLAVARLSRDRGSSSGERPEAASSFPSRYATASFAGSSKNWNSIPFRYGTGRAGGLAGPGVASESVATGVVPSPGTSGGRIVPAGMSSAVSLLRLATANGPDPMGWRPNGRSGSWSDRDAREDVGRGDRLGRRLEEATERGLEREHDGQRALGRDRDLVPRPRARTRVLGILEDADRERDILGCDRLAVVPAGVITQVEGPHGTRRVHGPALREVRHERPGRSVAHEPRVDERDEVAVGLGAGTQRADRDGSPEDPFAVRPRRRRKRSRPARARTRRSGAATGH